MKLIKSNILLFYYFSLILTYTHLERKNYWITVIKFLFYARFSFYVIPELLGFFFLLVVNAFLFGKSVLNALTLSV